MYFLTAIFSQFLVGRTNLVYSNTANLISVALYVALTLLFYQMFKPVSRRLSLLAALFSLAGCVLTALSLFHLASSHSPVFFFGFYCILIGYLIFRSTFLPRILGVLLVVAGVSWLLFMLPPIARYLTSYIEALGILAEGLLMLWLLVFGVSVQRWKQQADAAGDLHRSARMHY